MKTRLLFISMLMALSTGLFAQQQGEGRPERPKMKSPEEIAEAKAGRMRKEVGLSDKQYKKVYKLFVKDARYRQEKMEEAFGDKMPQGGPGMGGPGGPGMGGPGGPGMGGPGMGGQRPEGEAGQGQRPPRPEGMDAGQEIVSEEYLAKQEKKLKKILTEEQYTKWREKHPAERPELPPLEIKK